MKFLDLILRSSGIAEVFKSENNRSDVIIGQLKDKKERFTDPLLLEDQQQKINDRLEQDQLQAESITQRTSDLIEQDQLHSQGLMKGD